MSEYYLNYGVIAALGIVGTGFIAATFGAWRLIRPNNPTRQKAMAYECGIDAIGSRVRAGRAGSTSSSRTTAS